jgi:hypothetical protein
MKPSRFPTLAAILLFAFLAAACGTSSYARRRSEDRQVSQVVNEALRVAGIPIGQVEAKSYHGVVALIGEVASEQEKSRAETAVGGVGGVVRINNLILVKSRAAVEASGTPALAAIAGTNRI